MVDDAIIIKIIYYFHINNLLIFSQLIYLVVRLNCNHSKVRAKNYNKLKFEDENITGLIIFGKNKLSKDNLYMIRKNFFYFHKEHHIM